MEQTHWERCIIERILGDDTIEKISLISKRSLNNFITDAIQNNKPVACSPVIHLGVCDIMTLIHKVASWNGVVLSTIDLTNRIRVFIRVVK